MSVGKSPPLRRIHSDGTLENGSGRFALAYWRGRETREIVESLRPGGPASLKVKPGGRALDGNVRVKVPEERGFDVGSLERELI